MKMMRYALLLFLCLAATPTLHADGFLERIPFLGSSKQPKFLTPDKAFAINVNVRDAHTLVVDLKITPGHFLYRDKTAFTISPESAKTAGVKIIKVTTPEGEWKVDANFGKVQVFHQSYQAEITLQRENSAAQTIMLDATYQGCSDKGLCYPPIDKQLSVALPAVTPGATAAPLTVDSGVMVQPLPAASLPAADSNLQNENLQIAKCPG